MRYVENSRGMEPDYHNLAETGMRRTGSTDNVAHLYNFYIVHFLYIRAILYVYRGNEYRRLLPRPLGCLQIYSSRTTPVCCNDGRLVRWKMEVFDDAPNRYPLPPSQR